MIEIMPEYFWDDKHLRQDNYWLTKSTPSEVLATHCIEIPKNKTVMDIGVGTGDMADFLFQYRNNVVCVDISPTALNRVKNIALTYLTKDLAKAPAVDLAIAHLVFQHCSDETIIFILNNIKLISEGIISFQSCEEIGLGHSEYPMLFFRSLKAWEQLINQTNKKIYSWSNKLTIYREIVPTDPEQKARYFSWTIFRLV